MATTLDNKITITLYLPLQVYSGKPIQVLPSNNQPSLSSNFMSKGWVCHLINKMPKVIFSLSFREIKQMLTLRTQIKLLLKISSLHITSNNNRCRVEILLYRSGEHHKITLILSSKLSKNIKIIISNYKNTTNSSSSNIKIKEMFHKYGHRDLVIPIHSPTNLNKWYSKTLKDRAQISLSWWWWIHKQHSDTITYQKGKCFNNITKLISITSSLPMRILQIGQILLVAVIITYP